MAHLLSDPEFYVLVAVAIFLVVVWKPVRRTIVAALDSRAERIRQELDAARNLRDEAQQALAAIRLSEAAQSRLALARFFAENFAVQAGGLERTVVEGAPGLLGADAALA